MTRLIGPMLYGGLAACHAVQCVQHQLDLLSLAVVVLYAGLALLEVCEPRRAGPPPNDEHQVQI